jgi:hypothetical protein
VYLTKGTPATAAPTPPTPGSGSGSGSGSANASAIKPDAGPAASIAPPGMIVVKRIDGTVFAVSEKPVTLAEYKTVFADHKQATTGDDDPVTNITYDEARSYARTKGGRLLRPDEWDWASTTPGVAVSPAGQLEWVESPEGKRTVKQHGKTEVRADKEYKDVTFRMARDI